MQDILIVEDEREIAAHLVRYVQRAGFKAHVLNSGEHVITTIRELNPVLVILDLMLPVYNGIELCKQLRTFSDIPVLMLTAKKTDADRIIGLEAGADDYVCKPFNAKEVVLRVQSILKRVGKGMVDDGIHLVKETQSLSFQGTTIPLTKLEFSLLQLMHSKPHRIFSRQQLVQLSHDDSAEVSDRIVDSHVKNLRKKIKSLGIDDTLIEGVYGAGYRYLPPVKTF